MLRSLLLFATLFNTFIIYAQRDTAYFNINWIKSERETASFYRVCSKQDTIYKVDDYFTFGKLFRSGYRTSVASESYKYRVGHYVFYDSIGFVTREGDYDNGRKTGLWKSYYNHSAALKTEDNYYNDSIVGASFEFDLASRKVIAKKEYVNGLVAKKYEYNGSDTTMTVIKSSGDEREEIEFYKSGNVRRKRSYDGNREKSALCFSENGKLVPCDTVMKTGKIFNYIEQMPAAGYDMPAFLRTDLKYPRKARKLGIEGKVIVKFIVEEDGTVTNVSIVKGIGGGCDEEAVRVISEMPAWKPGKQNGIPVKVYFTLPIVFKL